VITWFGVDGAENGSPAKSHCTAHCTPLAFAYRTPAADIESSRSVFAFLRALSLTTASHRRNGSQGSIQEYVPPQSPANDRVHAHAHCRYPTPRHRSRNPVPYCNAANAPRSGPRRVPSKLSRTWLTSLQPPPRPASRPMPPLRLPFAV
jgi:hypothetical protein